jgi:hypothetical protein
LIVASFCWPHVGTPSTAFSCLCDADSEWPPIVSQRGGSQALAAYPESHLWRHRRGPLRRMRTIKGRPFSDKEKKNIWSQERGHLLDSTGK